MFPMHERKLLLWSKVPAVSKRPRMDIGTDTAVQLALYSMEYFSM